MESNDSPEIPDRGETSDVPGLPSGRACTIPVYHLLYLSESTLFLFLSGVFARLLVYKSYCSSRKLSHRKFGSFSWGKSSRNRFLLPSMLINLFPAKQSALRVEFSSMTRFEESLT